MHVEYLRCFRASQQKHLQLLPDTVRNKNVIEVLDDTILLINNLRDMVSQANSQLAATR